MFKKITNFIKYHNAFVIAAAIIFTAAVSAMAASEDVRDKVLGEKIATESGVDNTALLAADLNNFDMAMEIIGALEDPPEVENGNFYIDYQYKTLAIKDNVWQEVWREKQMTVSKRSLDGRDLGFYVMEELGEIVDYQLAYLKKAQEGEADKGVTVVLETTEYTGLIGLVLDTKTKILPGYEPVVVVEAPVIEPADAELSVDSELSSGYPELSSDESSDEENEIPAGAAYWEQLERNCLNDGGFWYNKTCNAEEELSLIPPLEGEEEPAEEEPAPTDEEEPADEELPEEEPVSEDEPMDEDEPADEDSTENELAVTDEESPVADESASDNETETETECPASSE